MVNSRACAPLCLSICFLGVASGVAQANGYQDLHQSAPGMATAYATNGAGADDLSAVFSNPASLGRFPGLNTVIGASVIFPEDTFTDLSATSGGGPVTGSPSVPRQFLDTSFGGAFYLGYQLSDRLHAGLAFNAPWATVSNYPDTAVSRYVAVDTDLLALNLNPMIAWKATNRLTFCAGLNIQYYDATFSTMIDTNGVSPGTAGDVLSTVEGDDVTLGFTLGVEADLGRTRVGLSYRSAIEHDFGGDVRLEGGDLAALDAALGGVTANGSADYTITTPWIATLGVAHQATDKLELYGSAALVGWSAFEDTRVEFGNGLPEVVVLNGWDDRTYLALGAGYQFTPELKVRTGVAYDRTPTPDRVRNPRAPNADRVYVGLGASWQARPDLKIDASYAHTFFDTARIDLDNGGGNTLAGDIDVDADIFMIQISKRW
jgi:long-chain fatty acid transport protein